MTLPRAMRKRTAALRRARFAEKYRDWHLPLPRPLWERLRIVRILDGRPITEWARATLAAAADDVLTKSGQHLRMRPESRLYRLSSDPSRVGAPIGCSQGGERVWIIERIEGLPLGLWTTQEAAQAGVGYLCDLTAEQGSDGAHMRYVLVRATDVICPGA